MSSGATIVVVDDDPHVRGLLRDCLEDESYRVLEAIDSRELFALLDAQEVDLVTLDIGLGGENGFDLVRDIRLTRDLGIVIVSGKGDLIDTVVGLELGADDYITKPFELRELVARVRSVLRRYERVRTGSRAMSAAERDTGPGQTDARTGALPDTRGAEILFDGWCLRPEARTLSEADGTPCELSGSEFKLLQLLVDNAHRALSRDEIMDSLRGRDWNPSDRAVDNLVAQLRKKIERPGRARLIGTVRGVGYLFSADVERR